EELAIALAAQDGRGHDAYDTPAARPDEGGDIVADRSVNERIVHDAFFRVTSAGFELRLDQRQEMRRRSRECERRRPDELERDETGVDDDEVGPLGKPRRVEDANVGRFHGYDLCSPPQAWMHLAPPDIHGIDSPRAACQQDFSKAAGRGADIEADAAARIKHRIEAEVIERGRELHPAARYVSVRRLGAQPRSGGNSLRRLRDANVVRRHAAGGNGALRLGAALEQTALDEQPIDANTASHANAPSADERVARRRSGTSAPWGLIRPVEQITRLDCCFQSARCDPSRGAGVNPSSDQ